MHYISPLLGSGVVHAKCETSPLIRPAVKNITRNKNYWWHFFTPTQAMHFGILVVKTSLHSLKMYSFRFATAILFILYNFFLLIAVINTSGLCHRLCVID